MKSKVGNIIKWVCVAILAVIVGLSSFTIIPTGYTGVRTTFGQVDSTTMQNGFNWKIPFVQHIQLVNNKQQDITYEGQIWSETSERTAIYYDGITVTYQINPERSAWIYANVSDYKNSLVNQSIVASAIKAASKQLKDQDATNRGIIEPLVLETLQNNLDEKYQTDTIIINKVTIANVDFDQSYNDAIAAKQRAQIESEQKAIENQIAIDKAAADAAVKLTQAQAEADALLIRAEAEAEYNRLLQESLSPEILQEMYIEKWDGALPRYMSGTTGGPELFIDMTSEENEAAPENQNNNVPVQTEQSTDNAASENE